MDIAGSLTWSICFLSDESERALITRTCRVDVDVDDEEREMELESELEMEMEMDAIFEGHKFFYCCCKGSGG